MGGNGHALPTEQAGEKLSIGSELDFKRTAATSQHIFSGIVNHLPFPFDVSPGNDTYLDVPVTVVQEFHGALGKSERFRFSVNYFPAEAPPEVGKLYLFFADRSGPSIWVRKAIRIENAAPQ